VCPIFLSLTKKYGRKADCNAKKEGQFSVHGFGFWFGEDAIFHQNTEML